jgi:hypothetical protein
MFVVFGAGLSLAQGGASDAPGPDALAQALAAKGCSDNRQYRAVGGVSCSGLNNDGGATDPDAVLENLGSTTKNKIDGLTLQARREDAACAQGAAAGGAGGTTVGPTNDQLASALVQSAIDNAMSFNPAGLVVSIPGLTQVQYDYKGLANGAEIRTFKIGGHLDGNAEQAKLYLQMDGDVEGDKNLYVQYTVNLQTTKSPFPAWSPFLSGPGNVAPAFRRQGIDTLSATADFSEKGQHRNGLAIWYDYEYDWHAEKVGARPEDIMKPAGGAMPDLASYPYGGDWVGEAWGSETRFRRTRKEFVSQFSPGLAGTMTPEQGSEGVIMSLNVKHKAAFYFHIDFNGNVAGRGVVVYTLDPDLCGVATLTRQVNERVNFMKYLPVILAAAQRLGDFAAKRFLTNWTQEPTAVTQKMDEFIRTLPPKVEPAAGAEEVAAWLAKHPEVNVGNNAYAIVEVEGFPKRIVWRPSGAKQYADPDIVPPLDRLGPRVFNRWKWFTSDKDFGENFDSETQILEYLARIIGPDAKGTIRIYSRLPTCQFCTGVIEEAYWYFKNVTLIVTSGP